MVDCLLCLQCDQEIKKCIQVNSREWMDNDIKKLIDKHLWPICTIKENAWLCQPCTEELKDFHKFYKRIEKAHNDFKSLLKCEIDTMEEDSKPKDLELQMLLEPDIVMGQNLEPGIVIKQEYEEPSEIRPMDDFQEETASTEDMLTNRDNPDINKHASEFNCDEGDDSDSDDDMPLIHQVKSDKKTSAVPQSKDDDSKNNDDANEYNCDSDSDPLKSTDESKKEKANSKISTTEKSNMNRKSYYTLKTTRWEADKFVREHYEITCNKCDKTFDTFPILCQHYAEVHNERGYVTCCEMKFFERCLLVDHINFHLNPEYFKCKVCGKVYEQRCYLRDHMKLHEEKKFECDVCSKKFPRKFQLDRHKLTHSVDGNRKYCCHICPKVSPTKRAIKRHIRFAHKMGYDFKCTICDKAYKRSDNLKTHMATHTGTPLYQ